MVQHVLVKMPLLYSRPVSRHAAGVLPTEVEKREV